VQKPTFAPLVKNVSIAEIENKMEAEDIEEEQTV
jgi:hypothetical protein